MSSIDSRLCSKWKVTLMIFDGFETGVVVFCDCFVLFCFVWFLSIMQLEIYERTTVYKKVLQNHPLSSNRKSTKSSFVLKSKVDYLPTCGGTMSITKYDARPSTTIKLLISVVSCVFSKNPFLVRYIDIPTSHL